MSGQAEQGGTDHHPGPPPHPVPAWRRRHPGEHRWPVTLVIAAAIVLQLVTPPQFAFSPRWLLPAVEGTLLLVLLVVNPFRMNRESAAVRVLELALVAVATMAVIWSAGRLIVLLVADAAPEDPATILLSGAAIWLTNVIVFALWYWELDRGGPAARANVRRPYPDLLFPQMTAADLAPHDWRPVFLDYLYVAFTNSTAFSPTDTLPLSRWAKTAMMLQSAVSLLVVALIIARAVNIVQ
ncbi:hypothetical protein [Micromonospora sp. NBC_01796]|uniref:hypothetical protein n=1 Tax=Micromonospora sp. NBC_01796 TaxID=2975987 RepID=UPI002DDAF382|nr:hypothetical protein [Micromonospora sp. NBC_01796]WSA86587.1 DUF1345 domain-containing protein [Micromonospora sp. NBC_01796]